MYQQDIFVNCPYCGVRILVLVDETPDSQSYYEDCSVCCSPILFDVWNDENGEIGIEAKRDDE